jgi:serine/threonine-protein kinase
LRPAPSERKQVAPEARRTVDIRRVSDSQPEDAQHSEVTSSEEETLIPRPSRPRNPAVAAESSARSSERKSNRLALLGMGGGVLVGLLLGGWLALHSEPAPQTGTVTAKPSTLTEPTVHEEPARPAPAQAVAEAVQPPPKTEPEPAPAPSAKPPEKSPAVSAPVREEHKPEPTRPAAIVERPGSQSGRGTVRFAVTPWADVSCDGRKLGTTPLPDVSLAVGVYECKFSNPELGTIKTQRVEVKPNSHTRVVVKF